MGRLRGSGQCRCPRLDRLQRPGQLRRHHEALYRLAEKCSAPETPGHRSGNQCRHLLLAQRGRQLYQWRHLAGGWRGFPGRPCLAPGQGKELRAVEWLSPGGNAEGDSGVGEGIEIDTNTWVERGLTTPPFIKGG